MWRTIKDFFLDIFFPKACFGCQREGDYFCQDCQSVLEINRFHQKYSIQNLKDLYWALPYQNPFVKNLIQKFKYEPFVKELAKSLSSFIIEHLSLTEKADSFSDFVIIPIPLEKRRLKWRGYNQAEEIGRHLAEFLTIPLISNCLIKIKNTPAQVELVNGARRENLKGAFSIRNQELINNKKIILIDDVYTTGATMEEAVKVLKLAGTKEIVGLVAARG